MKKMNKKILLLSFVISFVLLFGGWFTYQYYGAEKPIQDKIAELEGVQLVQLAVDQNKAELTLHFEDQPQFGADLLEIDHFFEASKKEAHLSISKEQGENHPWWLQHSAEITEAIHQKEYSRIQSILDGWEEAGLITEGNVMMNQKHLFIYVQPVLDSASKEKPEIYIYLPLPLDQAVK